MTNKASQTLASAHVSSHPPTHTRAMIKQLLALTLVLFFSAQTLALGHLSEHEFDKHQHQGQVCVAWLHAQLSSDTSLAYHPPAPVFAALSDLPARLDERLPPGSSLSYFRARAPPASV